MAENFDDKKLGEQIRWNYKLKYTVLVACLGLLWLVSSAVRTGEQTVKTINRRSVEARKKWIETAATAKQPLAESTASVQVASAAQSIAAKSKLPANVNDALLNDPDSSEMMDEAEIQLYGLILDSIGLDKKSEAGRQLVEARYHELQGLMTDRENAYNLEFGMSSVKNTIVLNALMVIDSWPIVLVVAIALVLAISLQQRAVEIMLANMIRQATDDKDKAVQLAATGFTAGTFSPRLVDGERIFLYRRALILMPEPFITLCLLAAIGYLSFNMPQAQIPSRIAMLSSITGYHTVVIILACLLGLVLIKTKNYFDAQIKTAIGTRVFTRTSLTIYKFVRHLIGFGAKSSITKITLTSASMLAIGSLFFPWIGNWGLYGYQFFVRQRPIIDGKIQFFMIDPRVFNEMRIQLIITLIFVVVVFAGRAIPRLETLQQYIRIVRVYSLLILGMIANIVCFLLLMAYRQDRELPRALMAMLLGNGDLEAPRGLPLLFQEPLYGFYTFAASVFAICLIIWAGLAIERNPALRNPAHLGYPGIQPEALKG